MAVTEKSSISVNADGDDDDDGDEEVINENDDDLTMDHQETEDTEDIPKKIMRNVGELRNICS